MQKKSLPFKLSPIWMLVALPSLAFSQNYLEIPDERPEQLVQLEKIAGHNQAMSPKKPSKVSKWVEKHLEAKTYIKKHSLFDWYLGLAAGRNTGRFLYEKSDLDQFNLGASGYSGQLYIGAGRLFKAGLYAGIEFAADYSSLHHQDITLEPKWHQENDRKNGVYLSFVPGFQWANNDRVYVKIGGGSSRIRHATTSVGQLWVGPSNTRYRLGAHWGLGYETPLQKHYSLRFEYLQGMYEEQKSEASRMNESYSGRWRIVNSDDQFLIGVTYRQDELSTRYHRHLTGQRINGPYLGLSGARDGNLFYVQHISNSGTVDDRIQTDSSGYLISSQAGYAFQPRAYTRYYLGAEASASMSNANDNAGGESRMRVLDTYGGSLNPGYRWHDNGIVYGKIGTQYTHFKRQYEASNSSPQGQLGDGFSARRFGLLLGLGYEIRLDERWGVRAEYQSTQYPPMKVYNGESMHEWHPRQNLYALGVTYRWGIAQLFPALKKHRHQQPEATQIKAPSFDVQMQAPEVITTKPAKDHGAIKVNQSTGYIVSGLSSKTRSMFDYYVGAVVGPELSAYRYQKTDGDQFNLGGQGFAVRAFLGAGWLHHKGCYAGGEVYADTSNAMHADASANTRWTQENLRPYGFGASIVPGFQANKHDRWFLKVGVQNSLIRHRVVEGGQDYVGPAFSTYQLGYHYGLGVMSEIMPHWQARIEYAHHVYQGQILASNTMNGTSEYGRWQIIPSDDQILLGASYHLPVTSKVIDRPIKHYNWFGPYLGASISQDTYHIKYRQYSSSDHLSELNRMNAHGPQFTATAGFGDLWWPRVYGASELSFHYSTSSDSLTSTDRFRALESYEGSVLPGYLVRPNSIAYGRFGLNYQHIRHPFITLNSSPQGNQGPGFELRRWGLRMGLGYEWYVGNHLSVRGEYNYTAYPHVKIATETALHEWMFHENLFTIGVNYRFMPKAKSIWLKWHEKATHEKSMAPASVEKSTVDSSKTDEEDFIVTQLEPQSEVQTKPSVDQAEPPISEPLPKENLPKVPEEPQNVSSAVEEPVALPDETDLPEEEKIQSEVWKEVEAVAHEKKQVSETAQQKVVPDTQHIQPKQPHSAVNVKDNISTEKSKNKDKSVSLFGKIFWDNGSEYYVGSKLFQESGYYRYQKTDGDQFHLGAQGVGLGVFLGMGRLWGTAYLGVEGFADYSTAFHRNTTSDPKWSQQNTKPFDFGGSLMPGWQVTSADRLYVRAGIQNGFVKHDTETEGTNWVGPTYAVNQWGYHLGFGVQTAVIQNLDLRFEYKYSLYQGQRAYSATQNDDQAGQWLITPGMDQFSVAASYHLRKFDDLNLKKITHVDWQGLYVGGSVGRDTQILTFNRYNSEKALTQVLRGRAQGFNIAGHAGYRHVLFEKLVMAAEGEGGYSTSHDGLTSDEAFKILDNASASFLPGYLLHSNGMIYARMGANYAHFSRAYQALNLSPMGTRGLGFDVHRYGMVAGFGYELNLHDRLSLRAEYLYSQYNNVTILYENETYRWIPNQHLYRLAINYQFSF